MVCRTAFSSKDIPEQWALTIQASSEVAIFIMSSAWMRRVMVT